MLVSFAVAPDHSVHSAYCDSEAHVFFFQAVDVEDLGTLSSLPVCSGLVSILDVFLHVLVILLALLKLAIHEFLDTVHCCVPFLARLLVFFILEVLALLLQADACLLLLARPCQDLLYVLLKLLLLVLLVRPNFFKQRVLFFLGLEVATRVALPVVETDLGTV